MPHQLPPLITKTVRDYIDLAFRRKWFFIVPFVLFASLSFAYAFLKPAIYRSVALVVVEEEAVRNPFVSGLAVPTSVQRKLTTLMQKTMSAHHLKAVIAKLYLHKRMLKIKDEDAIIGVIRRNLHSSLQGSLIHLSFDGTDPTLCKEILDALTEVFVEESLKVEDIQTIKGIEFLRGQLEFYKKRLEVSEKELADYRKKHMKDLSVETTTELKNLIGFPSGVNVNVSRLMGFEMQLIEIRMELNQLKEQQKSIADTLKNEDKIIVSQTVKVTDPVTRQMNDQLVGLQIKLNNLLVDSSPDHPEVLRLKKKIGNMEELLKERSEKKIEEETYSLNPVRVELTQRLNNVKSRIEALEEKEKLLVLLTKKYNKKVELLPDEEREHKRLMRNYGVNSTIYNMLLQKLETAEMTKRLEGEEEGTKFKLLDPPSFPRKPIKPKRKKILFMGFAVGIMLGAGCLFGVEFMDKSFKDDKGLAEILGVPVLSSIPNMLTEQEEKIRKSRQRLTLILLAGFVVSIIMFVVIKKVVGSAVKP